MATLVTAGVVSISSISTPSSKYAQAFGCRYSARKSLSVPANITSSGDGERRLPNSFISSSSLKKFRSFSVQGETDSNSSVQEKAPFGYTRKDVLLIGLGVTILGFGLKSGLEYVGVDSLKAGNVVQLVLVLGLTVGWILTYIFRVSTKDMTYAQQLRDYENKVLEKRLEELPEADLEVLLAQVEEEKQLLQNKNHILKNLSITSNLNMAEHMPERMPERIKRWLRTEWLWRAYANRLHTQWQKNYLWILVEPYRRPRSFLPFISVNIAAFYTGVVGAAIKEQLYKEKYWEEHPGEAVPMMKPSFYWGPWRVQREDFKEP